MFLRSRFCRSSASRQELRSDEDLVEGRKIDPKGSADRRPSIGYGVEKNDGSTADRPVGGGIRRDSDPPPPPPDDDARSWNNSNGSREPVTVTGFGFDIGDKLSDFLRVGICIGVGVGIGIGGFTGETVSANGDK